MSVTSNNAENETEADSAKRPFAATVGELLAETREKAGQDIPDVAHSLRISQRYLEAIEEGRNDDLPGTTYAVGFVRSYAEYLGLDEDEIVRRFKDESENLAATTELTFPKPIPEGGVPGGAVLLVGVVLALVAYGVWYINSEDGGQPVAQVDAVPERLSVVSNKQAATPQAGNVVSKDAVIARTEPKPEPEPEAEPAPEPEPEPQSEPAPEPQVETDAETTAQPEVVSRTSPEADPVSPPEASSATTQTPSEVALEATPDTAPVPEATPAPAPTPAPTIKAEAAVDPVPSRITVRAKSNSWIQIRDDAQEKLLFTRLLRKGDEYQVPDRPNLRLLTGNAGALDVLVDGKIVPSIGEAGDLRRNVALDPARLIEGKAVTN